MMELSTAAQSHLENYLQQMRLYLQGAKSVDAAEVERDIREHIDSELLDKPAPVSLQDLTPVLQRLGSPTQWVPAEDLSWWRTFTLRMRTGPKDWRLAYFSLGALILGFMFPPAFLIAIPASLCLARAAVSMAGNPHELRLAE